MEVRPWPSRAAAQDLSKAERFALAGLMVDPPTRRIIAGDREERVEPRVMRVLVALNLAQGKVLSRDDLIALCWDGLIVGDNAINRVISRLRAVLAELAGDAVRLETITKVGFRLVGEDPQGTRSSATGPIVSPVAAPGFQFSRRTMAVAGLGAATAISLAGFGVSAWSTRHRPDPRAVRLARKADLLMKSGLPGSTKQATRLLEQAVGIDPEYALGWGQLAGMYRHSFESFSAGERQSFHRMVNSAARRALEIEPGQPDALLALAVMRPFLGRWSDVETGLRAIHRNSPDHWYANAQLNLLLLDVGRAKEALPFRRRVVKIDPTIPVAQGLKALNELLADRLHDCDATLDRALATWPGHGSLWLMRYRTLLETGRPAAAAAFARDIRHRPDDFPPEAAEEEARLAEAINSSERAAKARARDSILAAMQGPDSTTRAAFMLALLGEGELALAALAAYFLGGRVGKDDWPAPNEFDHRPTSLLFYPSILALRGEPGFATILNRTGLEDYWRRSGSQPDFRRN